MKSIKKTYPEPSCLLNFRTLNPSVAWDSGTNNFKDHSQQCYQTVRSQCLSDQHYLCGYCEIKIPDNRLMQRVEHFHPKSPPVVNGHNWALDWNNLIAVCMGNTREDLAHSFPEQFTPPRLANMSCDAFKDKMISDRKLQVTPQYPSYDYFILNPLNIKAMPCLFDLDRRTGQLRPHEKNCAEISIHPNSFSTTQELVQNTINMLNLNCVKYNQKRLDILYIMDREVKAAKNNGQSPSQLKKKLARQKFSRSWPAFFTTWRILLAQDAESYLQSIDYPG